MKKPQNPRDMGRKGGKARAAKLTPERLSAIGKLGVAARKAKKEKAKEALDTGPSAR